jgi:isopenicillin-N N-acyltransferase-like protein
VCRIEGSALDRGRRHGADYAAEIRRYADDRVKLAGSGSWSGRPATREDVLGLAEAMIPAHRDYAPDLFEEMEALAGAAGLSTAEAIVVGGFTDFVDAVRAYGGDAPEEDDCTAVLVPAERGAGGGFLAQTWDMHDSATEHVVLLDVAPDEGPRARVFSTVGCLGQIGINEAGIAVGINNLTAEAGQVGVTWPFVVRRALQQSTLDAAVACVLDAKLSGAHNYLVMDAEGRGANIEAMPRSHAVDRLSDAPLVHTNHCLRPETQPDQAEKAPALLESSQARLARAEALIAAHDRIDVEFLMALTRDAEAICQRAVPPHHIESSGAVIMRPGTGDLWAVWGVPVENEYAHFGFDA